MCKPHINVTPLIDVLLVLLIIFMVVTPTKPSALDARIPQEPDDDPIVQTDPRALVVTISADSTLLLNKSSHGHINDPEALVAGLASVFQERERNMVYADSTAGDAKPRIEKTVFIKAPRKLDYGSVAKVVDAVKRGGANPVSLQIDDLD